ncbi:hypothetical protein BRC79_02600 [Halobacteriales archaeon QH_8_67_27]|nr:MAG: hypothetical protein BRC79_02600 [Halobacteriales archaeon QH_8_67_27]
MTSRRWQTGSSGCWPCSSSSGSRSRRRSSRSSPGDVTATRPLPAGARDGRSRLGRAARRRRDGARAVRRPERRARLRSGRHRGRPRPRRLPRPHRPATARPVDAAGVDEALEYATLGWPVAMVASAVVFVAPGGFGGTDVTALDGAAGAVAWLTLAVVATLGPAVAGLGFYHVVERYA